MPSVFVFEFVSGGGFHAVPGSPCPGGSLLVEGQAMLSALTADFSTLPGATVLSTRDARLPAINVCQAAVDATSVANEIDLWRAFDRLASRADWTLVVAPETDGWLLRCLERIESVGGRTLGPSLAMAKFASSKTATVDRLRLAGVSSTVGARLESLAEIPADAPWPIVVKPDDGCGSTDVRRIADQAELEALRQSGDLASAPRRWEQLVPGVACSVAAIVGETQSIVLPAVAQRLSDDGRFRYLGGEGPLDRPKRDRCERLARAALAAMPSTRGWIGFDLVLGDDESQDTVIEINPRVTTSYVGLRRLAPINLAKIWLDLAEGRPVETPSPRGRVRFSPSGAVERLRD